jgi:hypothetical protein
MQIGRKDLNAKWAGRQGAGMNIHMKTSIGSLSYIPLLQEDFPYNFYNSGCKCVFLRQSAIFCDQVSVVSYKMKTEDARSPKRRKTFIGLHTGKQTNSVALGPQANYTDWLTAACRRNLVPTFVDRGVSRGQRGGSHTVVNLSFLDRIR